MLYNLVLNKPYWFFSLKKLGIYVYELDFYFWDFYDYDPIE